jgi:hypothetical protein
VDTGWSRAAWPAAAAAALPTTLLDGSRSVTVGCSAAVVGVTSTVSVWPGSTFSVKLSASPAKAMVRVSDGS